MSLRAFDGSYRAGGKFHGAITAAAQPSFAAAGAAPGPLLNARLFVLVSMLASAYLAHYNAPKVRASRTTDHTPQWHRAPSLAASAWTALSCALLQFYNELAAPPDGSSKLGRFNLVCAAAFGLAAVLMSLIMGAGFLTFGASSQGLILNNYATTDGLAFVARCGIGLSIIFSCAAHGLLTVVLRGTT